MDLFTPLEKEVTIIASELIEKFNELKMRASGEWENSVEVVRVNDFKYEIHANDYTRYLTNGRVGGKRPPIEDLKEWVRNKFGYSDDKIVTSTAFAIATKIAKSGTNYYQQGGTDLVDGVITEQRQNELQRVLGVAFRHIILEDIRRKTKQVFA